MTVLVVGASGATGRLLVEQLLGRGTRVTASYDPGVGAEVGYLVRTKRGSTEVDPANPRFRIASVGTYPKYNTLVDRLGSISGWDWATVTDTCITPTETEPFPHIYYCMGRAEGAGAVEGDSGGPIFYWQGGSNGDAILYGVMHSGGTNHFKFSSMDDLQWDGLSMGRLTYF